MIKGRRKRGFTMRQVKWGIRRYIYLLLVLCLCFSQAISAKAASVQTEDARTVRVAFPIQEGMSYVRADGTPDGYNYMYLEKVAEYTGWKFVETGQDPQFRSTVISGCR